MSVGRRSRLVVAGSRGPSAADRRGEDAPALAPFDPVARVEWWWRQVRRFHSGWRLEAGGAAVAELSGEGVFSNTSSARLAGRSLEIRRGWTGSLELRAPGADEALLRAEMRWSGGHRITTPAGEVLELVPVGFWHRAHELRNADGHVLLRLESHDAFASHELRVEFEDAARRRDDLPLLVVLATAVAYTRKRHS